VSLGYDYLPLYTVQLTTITVRQASTDHSHSRAKQASIFTRPINEYAYNIADSNAQGQAARKAHKPNTAGHLAKKF